MADVLKLQGVSAGYGEAVVLNGVSFTLQPGTALALLGRNGVGKTTLINTIIGLTRMRGGSIHFDGRDVTRQRPDERARAGIGWVPQERLVFPSLTVEERHTQERHWMEMWKDAKNELKQLREDLKKETDEEVRKELLLDIEGWKKRKGDWAKLLGLNEGSGSSTMEENGVNIAVV